MRFDILALIIIINFIIIIINFIIFIIINIIIIIWFEKHSFEKPPRPTNYDVNEDVIII